MVCFGNNLLEKILEYFEWHKMERQKMNKSKKYESHRILVMQCLQEFDNHCGGTADRLKPFLFILREAYLTKRILFIHWTLPAKLEEYLLPPIGGIDWRVPEWMEETVR